MRGVLTGAVVMAALCAPGAAADSDLIAHGDAAGLTSAMTALGFRCDTRGEDTACMFRGQGGGIMSVTHDAVGMFTVLFAGASDNASIADAYGAMAARLVFGDESLADRFPEPANVAALCPELGHVGTGDDAGWCDASVVFAPSGGEVVQNITRDVLAALGADANADRHTVNAAAARAAIDPGVYVVLRSSESAPQMLGMSWISTDGVPQDAE